MICKNVLLKLLGIKESKRPINIVLIDKNKYDIYEMGHPDYKHEQGVIITNIGTSEECIFTSDGKKYFLSSLYLIHFI